MTYTQTDPITAALLIIGDEILSGRTRDKNIGTVADFCGAMGIELREVRVVTDEMDAIIRAVNALRAENTYVFTTGGIGPTHDDITADAVSKAFEVELPINDEARKILEDRYGTVDVSPERLRMARIPAGASLINNSVSGAPGFVLGNVHVMAGVPKIMEAMLEDLATRLKGGARMLSRSVDCAVGESVIAAGLGAIQQEFPQLKLGSYPQMGRQPIFTQLVIRGTDEAAVEEATARVRALVEQMHEAKNIKLAKDQV